MVFAIYTLCFSFPIEIWLFFTVLMFTLFIFDIDHIVFFMVFAIYTPCFSFPIVIGSFLTLIIFTRYTEYINHIVFFMICTESSSRFPFQIKTGLFFTSRVFTLFRLHIYHTILFMIIAKSPSSLTFKIKTGLFCTFFIFTPPIHNIDHSILFMIIAKSPPRLTFKIKTWLCCATISFTFLSSTGYTWYTKHDRSRNHLDGRYIRCIHRSCKRRDVVGGSVVLAHYVCIYIPPKTYYGKKSIFRGFRIPPKTAKLTIRHSYWLHISRPIHPMMDWFVLTTYLDHGVEHPYLWLLSILSQHCIVHRVKNQFPFQKSYHQWCGLPTHIPKHGIRKNCSYVLSKLSPSMGRGFSPQTPFRIPGTNTTGWPRI